jgi:hypothetical protein
MEVIQMSADSRMNCLARFCLRKSVTNVSRGEGGTDIDWP